MFLGGGVENDISSWEKVAFLQYILPDIKFSSTWFVV